MCACGCTYVAEDRRRLYSVKYGSKYMQCMSVLAVLHSLIRTHVCRCIRTIQSTIQPSVGHCCAIL